MPLEINIDCTFDCPTCQRKATVPADKVTRGGEVACPCGARLPFAEADVASAQAAIADALRQLRKLERDLG